MFAERCDCGICVSTEIWLETQGCRRPGARSQGRARYLRAGVWRNGSVVTTERAVFNERNRSGTGLQGIAYGVKFVTRVELGWGERSEYQRSARSIRRYQLRVWKAIAGTREYQRVSASEIQYVTVQKTLKK